MTKIKLSVSGLILTFALIPAMALAQESSSDLRNTIQNSVLSDPRVANVPPEQLQSLVDALVAEATAKGMTSADILTRPQSAAAGTTFVSPQPPVGMCQPGWQGYLCQFNRVFGFEGNNYEMPIILFVLSALLAAVTWEMILHHRKVLAKKAAQSSAPVAPPVSIPPKV